jgi:hypothetical protein
MKKVDILLKELDEIDQLKDAGRISQREHDIRSREVAERILKGKNQRTGFFDDMPEL